MTEIPDDVMKAARKAIEDASGGAVMCIARAILAERERCAKVASDVREEWAGDSELWKRDGMINAASQSTAMAHGAAIIVRRINNI